ncbi:MAG: glycine cleavage system protein H [Chloroflexota bacterium]|nr:glycine cleavage system protein H [Chloroflexota bacterium]
MRRKPGQRAPLGRSFRIAQVKEFHLPDDLYYDRREHIWARVEPEGVRTGLDAFGACAAGTFAYVKLLPKGRQVQKGRPFGSMEAGKYVGPLKAPVSGTVVQLNQELLANPRLANADHYGGGWFVVIDPSNLETELADLAHGEAVQAWLEEEVKDYEEGGKLKPEGERECA